MSETDMLEIGKAAVALAERRGARQAAAGVSRVREVEVQWRDGKLEKISEATTRGLDLELYVDGRYAAVSTSDLRSEALERFIADAAALTRQLASDPFRALPDPELYDGRAELELELEDPRYGEVDAAGRRRLAREMEAAARAVSGGAAIISVTSYFGDTRAESVRVHSDGFVGTRRSTQFAMGTEVSVNDPDGRRPEEGHSAVARFFGDLPGAESVGRIAAERALARVGAEKGASARLVMAVENRVAGRLVHALLGPLSAGSLQQKRSFLDGQLGRPIGNAQLTVADDPHLRRGLGSRLFDDEGIAARRFPIFEAGVLRHYYVDNYYGRKLGMTPTTRGLSNLAWKLGDQGRDALFAAMREGIFVTGFLGGNSNGTTGDFSLGVQGYRVRGGILAEPVGEMNIAGNQRELWRHLVAVGNDPHPYSRLRTPTLVFEGVQFAGV